MTDTKSEPRDSAGYLLTADDPAPIRIFNPAGRSPFLLTGDHAGIAFPARLADMGISPGDRARHIACDIGVRETGLLLAERLDATFIHQSYSRLVIDCNRHPGAPDAMPAMSDGTMIPANRDLSPTDAAERLRAIHTPYHAAIAAAIDRRTAGGQPTIFVALHSFTPVMAGQRRPWDVGILHDRGEPAFAKAVLAAMTGQGGYVAADNEPYHMDDTDYSVPHHAYGRGLAYVEVEFRQDHLAAPGGPALWADRFARALIAAAQAIG